MNWKKHAFTFVAIFLLIGAIFLLPMTCRSRSSQGSFRPAGARVVELSLAGQPPGGSPQSPYSYVIRAEVADTKEKRQGGLGGRSALEPGYGMLYVYDEPQQSAFSEVTTAFPVTLAFLSEDGTIVEMHDAGAREATAFAPREPVRYALEVRRGWFEDRGVAAGARFRLPPELSTGPRPAAEARPGGP